jgi:protein-tyrosine phosphatase
MSDKIFTVTFVCTGNTCRSPMAEAMFKALTKENCDKILVQSRGLAANEGEPASTYAISVMEEQNVDISTHKATPLDLYDLRETDLFVCMTTSHRNALLRYGVDEQKLEVLNVSDPFGGTKQDYIECAEQIKSKLGKLYELIREKI